MKEQDFIVAVEAESNAPRRANKKGIYCIKLDGEIVYIGSTSRPFQKRWNEHFYYINRPYKKPSQYKLYEYLNAKLEEGNHEISMEPIIQFDLEEEVNLKQMEYDLIQSVPNLLNSEYEYGSHFQISKCKEKAAWEE